MPLFNQSFCSILLREATGMVSFQGMVLGQIRMCPHCCWGRSVCYSTLQTEPYFSSPLQGELSRHLSISEFVFSLLLKLIQTRYFSSRGWNPTHVCTFSPLLNLVVFINTVVVVVLIYCLLCILGNTLHIAANIWVMGSSCSVYLQVNCGVVYSGGRIHYTVLILAIAKCQPKFRCNLITSRDFPWSKIAGGFSQDRNLRFLKLSLYVFFSFKLPAFHNSR